MTTQTTHAPPLARQWPARLVSWLTLTASGGPAAVVSYQHMTTLATRLGSEPLVAHLMPFTSDGVIISASWTIYETKRRTTDEPVLAWVMLVAGIVVTLVVNAAAGGGHGLGGRALASWPAVAFTMAFECAVLLAKMAAKTTARTTPDHAEPPGVPPVPEVVEGGSAGEPETAPDASDDAPGVPPQTTPEPLVPLDAEHAAKLAYEASIAAGEALSQRALAARFGIPRPRAKELMAEVASGANGYH